MISQDDLGARLAELARKHEITGAAVALGKAGAVAEAATGVLSTRTGAPVTTDSLFQIGSIAKVWTATLIMQLVGEGELSLDQTVASALPGFALADVTVRHLLTHTGGFEGDVFVDTGRGDDAIEKLVALLADTPRLFPPGALWSYNNAGYVVLGRLVEVLRGTPYGMALRTHLAGPLGLTHVATCADEAILYGTAVGHAGGKPVGVWSLMRSNEPAGSSLAMRARDLLTFATALMDGGILPRHLADLMREPQVDLPDLGRPASWGLGWELRHWQGGTVAGHDGSTPGQAAALLTAPSAGVAAVLLTNGGDPDPLLTELLHPLVEELAAVRAPAPLVPPAEPLAIDAGRYIGRYLSATVAWDVTADSAGALWLTATPLGVMAEHGEPQRFRLVRLRDDTFLFTGGAVAFIGGDRIEFLHTGRANPAVPRP
ncbi:serine hydrolase domain-containing protein [Nonomuraea sediminis]|uniref:serine hydrolase domain-containing protein n=1 Tax=Nonomuraea sediminis TaxID=2835864 RepID=UPI001BDBF602|nr:serine hydrolase domain-containing protein [Nonomuraea sediminis]